MLGRFIQSDTLVPNPSVPQSLNRYAYTLNNPVRYTDPSGHSFRDADESNTCGPGEICMSSNDIDDYYFTQRHPSEINTNARGDEYAKQVKQALNYCEANGCNPDVEAALRQEYRPFQMKMPGTLREQTYMMAVASGPEIASVLMLLGIDILDAIDDQLLSLPSPSYQNPWQGEILSITIEHDTVMYRVWGGDAAQTGKWLTPIRPSTQAEARSLLALPPNNSAIYISEVHVPAGTRIQIGVAAPNFGQPGGAVQVELIDRIPTSAFGPGEPLPRALLPRP